ncbi:MAG: aryl-sulfate sulfotransferase [Bdellovibrionales bacterium]|nr:aryl-sulfate sulfotransferase [Bdellovibrionales bacterium]
MRYQGITGQASEIKFIGGDSKVRFRYSDKYAHHDFDFASSDTLLVLRWVPLSKKEFSRIFGESTPYKQLWSDEVVGLKYKSQFRKVNSWSLSSFLDPDDLTKEQKNLILKGHELFHANAVSYSTTNPFNSLPAITVTARETNQVFVIDYRTGKLLWKSPKNFFSRPHDARITRDKTLTVYNNGAVDETSSVLEVDLLKNSVIWEYGSQLPLIVRWQFTSHELSGAQKLINGNFLVTHGVQGHIYEIDSEKKIVFSWPAAASFLKDILGHPAISLFKTEKIAVTKGQIQKLKGLE